MKTSEDELKRIRAGAARHVQEYLETDGERGYLYRGAPILLLTSRGRVSGEARTTPLIFGLDRDAFVVVASLGGSDRDPDWFRNLRANPFACVQAKAHRLRVRARIAGPYERPSLWRLMTLVYPAYIEYQDRTEREIPVVALEPLASRSAELKPLSKARKDLADATQTTRGEG